MTSKAQLINLGSRRLHRLSDADFYQILQESHGTALVIFTSSGCASCRAWKLILKEYLIDHPHMQVFEVDAHESMALANEYEVFHLPSLFLFQQGHFHCAIHCEANVEKLHATIESALQAPAEEEP